jgi:hypothetical protein
MVPSLHAPSTYLIAAAVVGFGVMLAGLLVLVFRCHVNAVAVAELIKRLLLARNMDRAIKLCLAADVPATTLILYLMGTQEPAEVLEQGQEAEQAGYRDAAASVRQVPFTERVAARAARGARELVRSKVRPWGLAAVIGGLAAFSCGLAAWLVAAPPIGWRVNWLAAGTLAGLLGAVHGVRTWRRTKAGLHHLAATVVPLLRPVEQMEKGELAAAAKAYEVYRQRRE